MDKIEYLDDNVKSADLDLSDHDLQEIEEGLATITVQGARLNEELLGLSEK